MNKRVLIIFVFVALTKFVSAVTPYPNINFITFLHTDRYCYVSGNYILINAFHFIDNSNETNNETALYVDLVDANSHFVKGEILKINNGIASGFLQIPDTLQTGEYVLRAYTNHSKKYVNSEILAKQRIYVSNRFGNNGPLTNAALKNLILPTDSAVKLLRQQSKYLTLNINNAIVSKRKKVTLNIAVNGISSLNASLSVKAVSPYELYYDSLNLRQANGSIINENQKNVINAFDESTGIIYSGQVINKKTLKPLPNIMVIASNEGSNIRFRTAITDENGNFDILLNSFYNMREFYFNCFTYPSLKYHGLAEVKLNSKFLTQSPISLYNEEIVEYEKSNDTINILKATINKAYSISYINETKDDLDIGESYEEKYLLGKNSHSTNLDDYIELIDFSEVIREIVPFARINEKNGNYSMATIDPVVNLVRDNAIVFVDGVPLRQLSEIISLKSNKIASIDVMGEPRYYGNIGFENGLVFVWTREKKFWENIDYDLVQSHSLKGLQSKVRFNFPSYNSEKQNNIPDFRQTLHWKPNIEINKESSSSIEFYTSDEAGWFEIVIAGVSDKGKQIFTRDFIYVE